MRRVLVVSAWVVGAAACVIVGFTAWLVGTEAGLRAAVAMAASRAPVPLSVERVEGRIWGRAGLYGIDVAPEGVQLRIDALRLEWIPAELFAKRLHVRRLVVEGIHVMLSPAAAAPEDTAAAAFTLPEIELPVLVQLDTLRLRDITLRQAGRTDSLVVQEVALDGLRYQKSLGVQRFVLATPWGEFSFRGSVRTSGEYPLDIAYQWNLEPPGLPRVIGFGAVTGNLDTLTIRQNVTAPARLYTQVRLMALTSRPRFDASARLEPLALDSLRTGMPAGRVAAQLAARGDAARQEVDLTARFDSPEYGNWHLEARARTAGETLDLDRLALSQRGTKTRIQASGHARLDSAKAPLRLLAEWSHLAWPPVGEAAITLPHGTLAFDGVPAEWHVRLETAVRTPRGVEESVRATGHGDTTSLDLERLAGSLLGGTVEAAGRLTWNPAVTWDVQAAARDVNAGLLAPEWPSRIAARLETSGAWSDSTWAARLVLDDLAGELRGRPLAGHLHFAGRSDTTSSLDTELRYGSAALAASGPVLAPIDLRWWLAAPSLSDLDERLAGRLAAHGLVEGADSVTSAAASVEASEVAFGGTSIRQVSLDGRLDRRRRDAVDLVAVARGIASPPLAPFDSLRVSLRGTRDLYDFAFALESASRRAAVAGTVAPRDSGWAGRVERLDLAVARNAPWSLAEPILFAVAPAGGRAGPVALRAGAARLDARAEWRTGGDAIVEASIAAYPLGNANALLPPQVRLDGALTATSRAVLRADGVLDAELALEPVSGTVTWTASEPVVVAFEQLRLGLRSDGEALRLDGGVRLPELGEVTTEAQLPGFRWNGFDSTQALTGALRAEASRWGLVEAFSPEVRKMQGQLHADVRFDGTVAAPRLAGEAHFENGALDLPSYGLELRQLQMSARGDGRGQWSVESSVESKPGSLSLDAQADLSDATRPRATARVAGKDFEAVDILEARVLVSPDLQLQMDGRRLEVTGEVTVPAARIDAGNRSIAMPVPPSPDVTVLREAPDTTALPYELRARVRLTLGDKVSLAGYGLKAVPEGSVVVTQEPGKPALGQGELSLRKGTYTGYGRELTIERGRLYYAGGPVDDPEVDIRASREIERDDVIVGFEVTGTLKQSQLSVFSDPDMPQSDAISYLLFNRPIAEAKSSESAIARETATAMGLQAGSAYTQKLASKIGLQEASLESEGSLQEASLMLGTYLTPSLYARYGIGLFDSANTFQISYFLSKHWTVEAETSDQNRAGIIYSIEP